MINKDSTENKKVGIKPTKPNDTIRTDVSAHVLIKDRDTGQVIVNKRG